MTDKRIKLTRRGAGGLTGGRRARSSSAVRPAGLVLSSPRRPYAHALSGRIPSPDPERRGRMQVLAGDVPSAVAPLTGCRLHPRRPCRVEVCELQKPEFRDLDGRRVACRPAASLDLGRLVPSHPLEESDDA